MELFVINLFLYYMEYTLHFINRISIHILNKFKKGMNILDSEIYEWNIFNFMERQNNTTHNRFHLINKNFHCILNIDLNHY
jgi:hypothetical protein